MIADFTTLKSDKYLLTADFFFICKIIEIIVIVKIREFNVFQWYLSHYFGFEESG